MFLDKIKNYTSYFIILAKSKKAVLKGLQDWQKSLKNPTAYYLDAFRFFYFYLPRQIVDHKNYFNKESRGFGEKALHSMWYLLYNKYKFENFLEIGVYRGQVISLLSLLAKIKNNEIAIHGISPFDNIGDTVSNYIKINYMNDVIENFNYFSLSAPALTKAYSTDDKAIDIICSRMWDCIYIDGSHDYDIAKKDWEICSIQVKVGGLIVLDDSSLYTDYRPPFFSFKGHPGPSKVAEEISSNSSGNNFKEVLRVGHNRVFERVN